MFHGSLDSGTLLVCFIKALTIIQQILMKARQKKCTPTTSVQGWHDMAPYYISPDTGNSQIISWVEVARSFSIHVDPKFRETRDLLRDMLFGFFDSWRWSSDISLFMPRYCINAHVQVSCCIAKCKLLHKSKLFSKPYPMVVQHDSSAIQKRYYFSTAVLYFLPISSHRKLANRTSLTGPRLFTRNKDILYEIVYTIISPFGMSP